LNYEFDWSVLLTYRELLFTGLLVTLKLTAISLALSMLLGFSLGVIRSCPLALLRWLGGVYVEFFRNIPLIIQLFFWYFGFPAILPEAWSGWLNRHNLEMIAAVAGLSTYTSAYTAEVVRAGIQSLPRGQWEAALSSGLGYLGAMRLVIMPQAVRIIIPPLINQFLNLTKNSSLAMTIGVAELTFQSQAVEAQTFRGFEATSAATGIYLALSLIISAATNALERGRLGRKT
jgi:polar amino acid transport system permease protein